MRVLIFASCVWVMTSCATGTTVTQGQPPPPPPPAIDPSLRQPCPDLPLAPDDRASTLLANHGQVTGLYHGCRHSQANLATAVQVWEDTAWDWYCKAVKQLGVKADSCPRQRLGAVGVDRRSGAPP